MSTAYYNEIDPYCAQWLRNLMAAGLIPPGRVDERSIKEVQPEDLANYDQCHFFAGLGGWAYALRLAGWPDDRPVWTGSCPCQPFSVAGKRKGAADERHLWPDFYRLIRAARPLVVFGEQVSGQPGYGWLDGVVADLEREAYACRAFDIPACAVGAPHRRNRLYWVADSEDADRRRASATDDRGWRSAETGGSSGADNRLAHRDLPRLEERSCVGGHVEQERPTAERGCGEFVGLEDSLSSIRRPSQSSGDDPDRPTPGREEGNGGLAGGMRGGPWSGYLLLGPDPLGKYRRTKPGVQLLAHGVPARVAKLRALGNAIVPQVAAAVVKAYLDTDPTF